MMCMNSIHMDMNIFLYVCSCICVFLYLCVGACVYSNTMLCMYSIYTDINMFLYVCVCDTVCVRLRVHSNLSNRSNPLIGTLTMRFDQFSCSFQLLRVHAHMQSYVYVHINIYMYMYVCIYISHTTSSRLIGGIDMERGARYVEQSEGFIGGHLVLRATNQQVCPMGNGVQELRRVSVRINRASRIKRRVSNAICPRLPGCYRTGHPF